MKQNRIYIREDLQNEIKKLCKSNNLLLTTALSSMVNFMIEDIITNKATREDFIKNIYFNYKTPIELSTKENNIGTFKIPERQKTIDKIMAEASDEENQLNMLNAG